MNEFGCHTEIEALNIGGGLKTVRNDDDGSIVLLPQKRRHRNLEQWVLRLINLQIRYPGRPWESLIPQQKVRPESVWSWQDQSGTWNPYNDQVIEIIEDARKSGKNVVNIESAGRKYQINVTGKSQTNLETNGSRVIRRTMELYSKRDWCCENCGYHMGDAKSKICTDCNHRRRKRYKHF